MAGMNVNRIWLILTTFFIGIAGIPCGYGVLAESGGLGGGYPGMNGSEVIAGAASTIPSPPLVTNPNAGHLPGSIISSPTSVTGLTGQTGSGFLCSGPDLAAGNLNHPPSVNAEDEFTFTITVTNSGTESTEETGIEVTLPGNVIITPSTTVPPLEPGESIEITITITIPPETSIGNGFFQVNLDPNRKNPECSRLNNNISDTILILPGGMTLEEYDLLTLQNDMIKYTELLSRLSHQGGGDPLYI